MCALDYLNLINEETKEKLIGLCLNRKLLSLDGETEYEEGEESDESMDEMDESSINIWYSLISIKFGLLIKLICSVSVGGGGGPPAERGGPTCQMGRSPPPLNGKNKNTRNISIYSVNTIKNIL